MGAYFVILFYLFLMVVFVMALIVWHLSVFLATRRAVIITQKEIKREREKRWMV